MSEDKTIEYFASNNWILAVKSRIFRSFHRHFCNLSAKFQTKTSQANRSRRWFSAFSPIFTASKRFVSPAKAANASFWHVQTNFWRWNREFFVHFTATFAFSDLRSHIRHHTSCLSIFSFYSGSLWAERNLQKWYVQILHIALSKFKPTTIAFNGALRGGPARRGSGPSTGSGTFVTETDDGSEGKAFPLPYKTKS